MPQVSMTPAVNLPPVSTTPMANNGNNIRLLIPQNELDLYVKSTSQRCPNKIFKTFLIEDFFPYATGVNGTIGAP
jgi:hypothetical protein